MDPPPDVDVTSRQSQEIDVEKYGVPNPSHLKTGEEELRGKQAFLVRFDHGDPENPKNFNPYFKAFITLEMGLLAFAGSLGTAIISPAEAVISQKFNVSLEVTVLVLALYILGPEPPISRSACAESD